MRLVATLISLALFLGSSAYAQEVGANCGIQAFPTGGCVVPSGADDGGEQAYVGLQFVVGSQNGLTAKIIAGIRTTSISDEGTTTGADLAIRFAPGVDGFVLDSVVVSGIMGESDTLGRLGAGYSYAQGSWLGSGAIENGIVGVGVDYAWSTGITEYFSELSFREESSGAGCPEGFNPRDIDTDEPFGGGPDDFFVLSTDLLLGDTTCEPETFDFFMGPGSG